MQKPTYTSKEIIRNTAISIPLGALGGGIRGSLGKYALSFFNPSLASTVGGFASFAALGAIAMPLAVLPYYLIENFINNNKYLEQHPNLKGFIKDTIGVLLNLAAVTSAALLLGTPLGATVISLMIIPTVFYVLSTLYRAISACVDATAPDSQLGVELS